MKKNWSLVTDGDLIPADTGRLTAGHKITLTLIELRTVTDFKVQSKKNFQKELKQRLGALTTKA
jgi:hypothetical protein